MMFVGVVGMQSSQHGYPKPHAARILKEQKLKVLRRKLIYKRKSRLDMDRGFKVRDPHGSR